MNTKIKFVIGFISAILLSACSQTPEQIEKELLATESIDQFQISASEVRHLGAEGIPIFLNVISSSLKTRYNVISYGKLNASIRHLYEMAQEGIYSKESASILFDVLEKQISIADTLITAKTLEIITGTAVGYDEDFVRSYSLSDENKRMQLIAIWKSKAGFSE